MKARPRIIGSWILSAAFGLRPMLSIAAAAIRPCPRAAPSAPIPMANPAASAIMALADESAAPAVSAAKAKLDDTRTLATTVMRDNTLRIFFILSHGPRLYRSFLLTLSAQAIRLVLMANGHGNINNT